LVAGKTNLTTAFSNLEIAVSNQEKKETYMSKNLTRKGLAFGALVALGASVFAGTPANAVGIDGSVTLAPSTGTEYTVLTDGTNTTTFDLTSSFAEKGAGKNLKFFVSDPNSNFTAVDASSSQYSATPSGWSSDGTAITVTFASAVNFKAGDKISVSGLTGTGTAAGAFPTNPATITAVAANKLSVSYAGTQTFATSNTVSSPSAALDKTSFARVTTASTADGWNYGVNDFVYDTRSSSNSTSKTLRLSQATAATKSVQVTAWVDENDNGKIESTESRSATRTVTFEKPSDLVVSTSLSPVIGDAALTAKISTTPVLNGEQTLATSAYAINASFTRQGSTAVLFNIGSAPSSWNDTTKQFSVAVTTLPAGTGSNATAATLDATNYRGITATAWTGLTSPAASSTFSGTTASTVVTAAGVATTTTGSAHNLKVGDIVTFTAGASAATAIGAASNGVTVVSVPSTTSFTWASTLTTALTTANTTDYTVTTWGSGVGLVNRVFAGAYTAQAYINGVSAGAKVSAGTVAVAVASATLASTASASVAGVSAADATANAVSVKTGTTTVPFTLTALDADGVAVTAGRPVVITTGALTGSVAAVGTFKINGLSSPVTLYTDAAGKVSFDVTETAGLVGSKVRVSAAVEGTVTVGADVTWVDQAFGLVDLNTTDASVPATYNREVLAGGSINLGLAVLDQWFQAPVDGTYRLKTSGSGVAEAYVPFASGKATVTVKDNGVTAVGSTFTSTIALQKATAGVFSSTPVSTTSVVTTVIAAPAVTLGAAGSGLYGNAVVTSVAVAAKALVAIDKRSSSVATPAYAHNLVLNGKVASATTSVGIEGAPVTVSGPANLLFENGQVTKLGSLTALTDSTGKFEFKVYSTTAQTDSVVTFTAEGVSKTIKVSFTGVSVGKTNVLTAAAGATTTQAGRAVDYTATVVDAQGNPVSGFALKATLTGAGYFAGSVNSSGAVETTTDINGKAVVKVLFSTQDAGTATVTFADNDASTATADNLKSIVLATEIGATDANVDIVNNRVTAVASYSKGKTVAFYVDGIKKWSKTSASDADVVLNYNLKKGTHTVTVKISGGFVTTEKFIVK
jgi:hypothetical protein